MTLSGQISEELVPVDPGQMPHRYPVAEGMGRSATGVACEAGGSALHRSGEIE